MSYKPPFLRSARAFSAIAVAIGSAALVGGLSIATPGPLNDEMVALASTITPASADFAGSTPLAQVEEPIVGDATSAVASSPAVQAQLNYALAHWNNYNIADFGDLNSVGGDCQNFVSQTLLARGWTMDADWYSYDGGEDWSAAWGYVPAFDEYLRSHPERGATIATLDERDTVKIGDIVMFDWEGNGALDHVQIVSSIDVVDGKIMIGMAGHNNDTDYRDLDATITVDHPGATAYFWRIP